MRVKKLVNSSEKPLRVRHPNGNESIVPPGGILENVDIVSSGEISSRATITYDLGEVNARRVYPKLRS